MAAYRFHSSNQFDMLSQIVPSIRSSTLSEYVVWGSFMNGGRETWELLWLKNKNNMKLCWENFCKCSWCHFIWLIIYESSLLLFPPCTLTHSHSSSPTALLKSSPKQSWIKHCPGFPCVSVGVKIARFGAHHDGHAQCSVFNDVFLWKV